ncbi:AMP-binding protein [Streptacidiphilus sp. 4-A2]|nr:AMP-binding protein [Streptacidiphilus sp. 4-A2]
MAVEFGDVSLSYAELNARANRLARLLVASGVGPERLVAVALPRSVEWLVSVLAVVKAGGAYLPVDPGYPRERIGYMLDDARPVCALTDLSHSEAVGEHVAQVLAVDSPALPRRWRPAGRGSDGCRAVVAAAGGESGLGDLHSGSGRPKGVVCHPHRHRQPGRRTDRALRRHPESRVLQFASPSFDAAPPRSVWRCCRGRGWCWRRRRSCCRVRGWWGVRGMG